MEFRNTFAVTCVCVFQFMLSTHAFAEPRSFEKLSLEELMDVTISTASRVDEQIAKAPAAVIVVSAEDIRRRGYSVLSDVLRDLPGMDVVENYFGEIGTLVPIRGVAGNNKIILLVNGMRVNPPGGESLPIRGDLSVRGLKQIEIMYGPASILYGQDAISGVINLITATPEQPVEGQVSAAAGSDDFQEAFAQFGSKFGLADAESRPLRVSGFLYYRDSELDDLSRRYPEYWSQAYGQSRIADGTPPRRYDDGLNAFAQLAAESTSLQLWYRNSARSTAEGGANGLLYFTDEARFEDSSVTAEGSHTFQLLPDLSLEAKIGYDRYEIDTDSRYVFPADEDHLFLNDFKYGLGTSTTFEQVLRYKPSEVFSLIGGAQLSYFDIIPKATIPGGADVNGNIVQQGGAFTYYTEAGNPASLHVEPRATNVNYDNVGGFIEARLQATDQLAFVAGCRLDSDSRFKRKPFSPRVAAVFSAADLPLTTKLIYSEAYVQPAPYFSYNVFDNGTYLNIANPDLNPEQAQSTELVVLWAPKNLQVQTSVYYNEQRDLILLGDLALAPNILADEVFLAPDGSMPRVLSHTANGGESTAIGFDISLRYDLPR